MIDLPMTPAEAIAKYGAIQNGVWQDEARFCVLLKIPPIIGGSWINSISKSFVEHIYCNRDFAPLLMTALENVQAMGFLGELITFDGCFEVRDVRGMPGCVSAHSYGLAIDINAAQNPLGQPSVMPAEFVRCFTIAGLTWGGNFKRIDGMHFSVGF